MKVSRSWMCDCLTFAAISAYFVVDRASREFEIYGRDIHMNFIVSQRDAMFKLIPELWPRLQADQVEAAAGAAKLAVARSARMVNLLGGVEFSLTGPEVSGVRSTNF